MMLKFVPRQERAGTGSSSSSAIFGKRSSFIRAGRYTHPKPYVATSRMDVILMYRTQCQTECPEAAVQRDS